MNYTSEIFERVNLQHIREFLFHGVECLEISNKSYEDRIEATHDKLVKRIKDSLSNEKEYEAIIGEIYGYATAIEDAYMEIGMQCGAILAIQLIGKAKVK